MVILLVLGSLSFVQESHAQISKMAVTPPGEISSQNLPSFSSGNKKFITLPKGYEKTVKSLEVRLQEKRQDLKVVEPRLSKNTKRIKNLHQQLGLVKRESGVKLIDFEKNPELWQATKEEVAVLAKAIRRDKAPVVSLKSNIKVLETELETYNKAASGNDILAVLSIRVKLLGPARVDTGKYFKMLASDVPIPTAIYLSEHFQNAQKIYSELTPKQIEYVLKNYDQYFRHLTLGEAVFRALPQIVN